MERKFTLYKESGWGTILCGISAVVIFEAGAGSLWLFSWKPWVAHLHWLVTGTSLLWMLADYAAVKKTGLTITSSELCIEFGRRFRLGIDWRDIEDVRAGEPPGLEKALDYKPGEFVRRLKLEGYKTVSFLGNANIHIVLKRPIVLRRKLRAQEIITIVGLEVDSPEVFLASAREALRSNVYGDHNEMTPFSQ